MEFNLENAEYFSISIPSEMSYYLNEEYLEFKWFEDRKNDFKSLESITNLKTIVPFRRKRPERALEDEKENFLLPIPRGKAGCGRDSKISSKDDSEVLNDFSTSLEKGSVGIRKQVSRSHVQSIGIPDSTSSDVETKGKNDSTGIKATNISISVKKEANTLHPKKKEEYILHEENNVVTVIAPPPVSGTFTPNSVKQRIEDFERLISSISSDGGRSKKTDIGNCPKNPIKNHISLNIFSRAADKIESKIDFPINACKNKDGHKGALVSFDIQQGNLEENVAVSEVSKQCSIKACDNKDFDGRKAVTNEKSYEDINGVGKCKAEHENKIKNINFVSKNKTAFISYPKKQETMYKEAGLEEKIGTKNGKEEVFKIRTDLDKRLNGTKTYSKKWEEKMTKAKQTQEKIIKECIIAPKLRDGKAGKRNQFQVK